MFIIGANYDSSTSLDFAPGTKTATVGTGTVITSGWLDCTGNSDKYATYPISGNITNYQTGTMKVRIKPNYSGNPPANRYLFGQNISAQTKNQIVVWHSSGGVLTLTVFDSSNVQKINASLGTWTPVSGTEYVFTLCFDFTTGSTKLFINGVQFGTTQTTTLTRDSTVTLFNIGGNYAANNQNCYFKDFVYSESVEYTTTHYSGYDVDDYNHLVPRRTCNVFGYMVDPSGDPISSITVSVIPTVEATLHNEAGQYSVSKKVSTTTDSTGYWNLDLIWSSEYDSSVTYQIDFALNGEILKNRKASGLLTFTVSDTTSANINDLI